MTVSDLARQQQVYPLQTILKQGSNNWPIYKQHFNSTDGVSSKDIRMGAAKLSKKLSDFFA
jgi:hypothetical protein